MPGMNHGCEWAYLVIIIHQIIFETECRLKINMQTNQWPWPPNWISLATWRFHDACCSAWMARPWIDEWFVVVAYFYV